LATWFKDGVALLGALDFEEKYQVKAFNDVTNKWEFQHGVFINFKPKKDCNVISYYRESLE